MVTVGIVLAGERADKQLVRSTSRAKAKVLAAARGAAQDAKEAIEHQGSADIAAAGNFGPKWTQGLHAKISEGGGFIKVSVFHDEPFFLVYERGALIKGKPLLWVPTSWSGIHNVFARDYPGRLFRVDRKSGVPLLLDVATKQVKYVGLDSVKIPKKFHILQIIQQVATKLKDFYKERYKAG